MCRDQSLKGEQNTSRWGNCEQMICMFACSMLSCKLSPFLSSLGPAAGSLPHSGLQRSVKVEVPDLGLLHCKYEEWKREGKGMVLLSVFISAASRRTWHAEAGRQHDPTAVWPWETGLSLEIPFQSLEFTSSLKVVFAMIQGEGRPRSYFWAGSWGGFACCHLLFEVASAELEHGCGGATCTGTTQPVWRRPTAHGDGGAAACRAPGPSGHLPGVWGKWQKPFKGLLLKEAPPEETPCLSALPDKMRRRKGA